MRFIKYLKDSIIGNIKGPLRKVMFWKRFFNSYFYSNLIDIARNPINTLNRSILKGKFKPKDCSIKIKKNVGFVKTSIKEIPELENSLDKLIKLLNEKDSIINSNYLKEDLKKKEAIKTYLIQSLEPSDLLNKNNEFIIKAALSENLLWSIADYTGWIPQINLINLLIGKPNQNQFLETTQLTHRDGGDANHLHVFIYLKDIDKNDGATHIIGNKFSRFFPNNYQKVGLKYALMRKINKILNKLGKGLLIPNPENFIPLEGKKGDIIIFDATNCPHYGGRTKKNGSRHILQFHYTRFAPYSKSFVNGQLKNLDITKSYEILELSRRIAKTPLQQLAIPNYYESR
tara:strand:+ start:366 stop:1397 length:1032 start_codon:yes stop_codon:yes gene_type:complete